MVYTSIQLWKHQIQLHNFAIEKFKQNGYAFWLAGCATGKTLAAYQVLCTIKPRAAIVFTTKPAITSAWISDSRFVYGVNIVPLLKGNSRDKAALMAEEIAANKHTIIIVNYETAREIPQEIADVGFEVAVADESHRLKSYNSKQSVELAKACVNVPYKLCMTATAWDDSPLDVYGQFRWLSPDIKKRGYPASIIYGRYHSDFFPHYATYYEKNNIRIPTGYKNIEELHHKIDDYIIRLDTEAVRDLPPYRMIDRYVDLYPKTRTIYEQMEAEMITVVDGNFVTADNPLVLGMRLHQITNGFYPSVDGVEQIQKNNAKIEETLSVVEEIGNEPVVIFTRFVEDVRLLRNSLEKVGKEVKLLTGEVQQQEEFKAGRGDVLIANIDAGSEGVDLSRADYCIFYSVGHSQTSYEQSRWRIRRNDRPKVYYRLIARNTIDSIIYEALDKKADMSIMIKDRLANVI